MKIETTTQTINLTAPLIFDSLRTHTCPQCGSIYYFYDDNRLVFVTTHRNTFSYVNAIRGRTEYYFVPRCPTCQAEFAHMVKAVELMQRHGD
jgi:hypothetical protein